MLVSAPAKSTADVVASIMTAIENNEVAQATEIMRLYSRQIDVGTGLRIIDMCIPKSMVTVIAMTISELKKNIPPKQAGLFLEKAASHANEQVVTCLLTKARLGQLSIPLESFIRAQTNVLTAFNRAATASPEIQLQSLQQFFTQPNNTYFSILPSPLRDQIGAYTFDNNKHAFRRFANIHNAIGAAYFFYTDEVSADVYTELETMNKLTTQYNTARNKERKTLSSKSFEPELICKHSFVRDM